MNIVDLPAPEDGVLSGSSEAVEKCLSRTGGVVAAMCLKPDLVGRRDVPVDVCLVRFVVVDRRIAGEVIVLSVSPSGGPVIVGHGHQIEVSQCHRIDGEWRSRRTRCSGGAVAAGDNTVSRYLAAANPL